MLRVTIISFLLIIVQISFGQIGYLTLDKPFYFEGDRINYSYSGSESIVIELFGINERLDQNVMVNKSSIGGLQLPHHIQTQWVLLRAYQWNVDATIHIVEQRFIPVFGADVVSDQDVLSPPSLSLDNISNYSAGSTIDVSMSDLTDSWIMSQVYADATVQIYEPYPSAQSVYHHPIKLESNYVAVEVPATHDNGLHGMFNLATAKTFFGRLKGDGTMIIVPLSTSVTDVAASWSTITVPSIGTVQASAPVFVSSKTVLALPQWPKTTPTVPKELGAIYKDYQELRQINKVLTPLKISQESDQSVLDIKPDRSFSIEDFIRFKTTKEFFEEVVAACKVINKDGVLDLRLLSNNKKYGDAAPLTIYNGQICTDINRILNTKLDKVSIFFKTQRLLDIFGIAGRNGVMIIESSVTDICPSSSAKFYDSVSSSQIQNPVFSHVLSRIKSTGGFLFNDLRNSYIQVSIDQNGEIVKGSQLYNSTGKDL